MTNIKTTTIILNTSKGIVKVVDGELGMVHYCPKEERWEKVIEEKKTETKLGKEFWHAVYHCEACGDYLGYRAGATPLSKK